MKFSLLTTGALGCALPWFGFFAVLATAAESGRKASSPSLAADAMRLLHAQCLSCHNAEKHKGGLVMTNREGVLKGGDNGQVVVPGKPDQSLLFRALQPDADPHMPPKKQLATNQIALVGRWIVAGLPWDTAALARAAAPREVRLGELPPSYRPVLALALSRDGTRLAVGRGNRIVVHDAGATNFPIVAEVKAHRDAVRALAWSADGRRLASGGFREIIVRDAVTLEPVWSATSNLLDRVTALRISDAGNRLVAAEGATEVSGWIRVFDADSGQPITAWQAHSDTVFDLDLSLDGKLLATASGDKLVKLWEVASQKELARLEGHVGAVMGCAFNTNASELVSVGVDKQLKVWDVQTREGVITVGGRKHGFNAVAWSADGRRVVAGDDDGRLYSFTEFKRHTGEQSSSGAKERQLGQWREPLHAVTVNADGKRILAGGQDGVVRVVNGEGKELAKLEPTESGDVPFPLTPALSLGERENPRPTLDKLSASNSSNAAVRASLSLRERAGVRGKEASNQAGSADLQNGSQSLLTSAPTSPSFVHDVLPLLAKAGCNAGACHAKADGQNGFHLSVFSYDPEADYAEIVKESRGRRVFPAAPEESLFLLKPTAALEHGGGQRFQPGSETYETLVHWVRGGMVYQHTNEPALVRISVEPRERSYRKGAAQQLRVQAHYSDGSTRDVTGLADYVANDKEIARVDEQGRVQVGGLSGEAAVVARFMGFVDATRVTVPADRTLPAKRYAVLPVHNFIDELAYAHFRKLGLFPSELCTEAEFLRRAYLDTIGVLPTPEEAREFLQSFGGNADNEATGDQSEVAIGAKEASGAGSPLTPALSPLRGEGVARDARGDADARRRVHAPSLGKAETENAAGDFRTVNDPRRAPSPLNGERAGVRGEKAKSFAIEKSGTAPTQPQVRRAAVIEELLARPEYADYWANKWADLLRPNPDRVGVKSVFLLDQWLREAFRANKPYDQFVRDILLAEGSNHRDGPVVIYRDRREPPELTTMFSQLFLGVRMECAKCHHHPNEKWSQDDFYQFAAFFAPLKQKGAGLSPPISAGTERFYFAPGGTVKHPVTDAVMKPRPLDGAVLELAENTDPRRLLADWLTDPKNPFFAKAAVNRVWAAFFGRGFVEPVDDFRVSNPAVNEPLLNALAEDFARHGYDLKHLMRTILSSRLYQLSSTPNESNLTDTRNFSRSYRRRLPAEVLLDAVNDVTAAPDDFNGCPPGTRALQTWSYKVNSHFLDAFGRPNPSSDCPCERDLHSSVVQSLHMMNSRRLQEKLTHAEGRVKQLAESQRTPAEIVTDLYLAAFSRFPTEEELKRATAAYVREKATRQTATEDVLWALLNSAEFVFNH